MLQKFLHRRICQKSQIGESRDCNEATLLIVGCIAPTQNVPNVQIRDVNERFHEYQESIRWALCDTPFRNVVFCDNSGYDLSSLEDFKIVALRKQKNLEIVSFQGNIEEVTIHGKGYGEGEIIKYVLEHSALLCETDCFYKLTGRLTISNIDEILKRTHGEIYFNLNYPYWNMFDTRFYKISIKAYKQYFRDAYRRVDDDNLQWLEKIFYDIAKEKALTSKIKCYPYPQFVGKSGSTGADYHVDKVDMKLFSILCLLQLFNNKYIMKALRLRFKVKKRNVRI